VNAKDRKKLIVNYSIFARTCLRDSYVGGTRKIRTILITQALDEVHIPTQESNYKSSFIAKLSCNTPTVVTSEGRTGEYEDADVNSDIHFNHQKGSLIYIVCKDIADSLDEAVRLDAIIINFSNAFDLVPHDRLLKELAASGVDS
jgi:hypothetical protein